jgi:hydrogenase-4 component F
MTDREPRVQTPSATSRAFAWRVAVAAISVCGSAAAALLGVAAAVGFGGIDPIGRVAALGVAFAWFGASAAGPSYYAAEFSEGPSGQRTILRLAILTQVFAVALAVAAVSRNLAVTWVSLETTTIVGAFLVAAGDHRRDALEAAWKFAVLCFAGVGFGLVGIGLLAASAGGISGVVPTNLDSLARVSARLDPRLLSLALAALLVGFGTKAGLFPLHWWLPDAHSQGPTPVSALMSGGLVATSLAVIVKVLATLQGVALVGAFQHVLVGSGVLGLFVASFSMIDQRDAKRFLAFSTVENVSVMAIAAGISTPLALAAFAVHLVGHAAIKTSAFLSLGALVARRASREVDDLAGAIGRESGAASVLLVSTSALAAFPPSPLFVSELLLVFAAFSAGMPGIALAAVVLLTVAFVATAQFSVAVCLGAEKARGARGRQLASLYTAISLTPIAVAVGITLARPEWVTALVSGAAVATTGRLPW